MSLLSGISVTCFAASYLVALVLEASRLFFRSRVRLAFVIGFTAAGFIAQTLFLAYRAGQGEVSPLSSNFDWCLVAAWMLIGAYLYLGFYYPQTAMGLFMLPLALAVIGAAWMFADRNPIAPAPASQVWGMIHGVFLLLGTVAVMVGFVAGLMYLVQAYRLKHKLPPPQNFRLPSLEWLEKVNSRMVLISALMVGIGFLAGIILKIIGEKKVAELPWSDPVVWSSGMMLAWLVGSAIFNAVYKPSRQGRKVAYLTVVSFVFLVIAIGTLLVVDTKHGHKTEPATGPKLSTELRLDRRGAMKLQMIGCSYHNAPVEKRERLAFTTVQASAALDELRSRFPSSEAVLISTCNRIEIYTAAEDPRSSPTHEEVARFVADFHGLPIYEVFDDLFERNGEDVVRHLFTVAASLDSMVVGEPQILSQVKQAYELANQRNSTGPLTNAIFQAAVRVAKRVTTETMLHQSRVSIPSVAVADFAREIFERFDDKEVLVIGAGEMGEETLQYLADEGARSVTVINRNLERAEQLAEKWHGRAEPWSRLGDLLTRADLVVSTTGAREPVVSLAQFREIEKRRGQKTLFILDLAMPRDFDPAIGESLGVYLYSIDDLQAACQRNRQRRDKELPMALHIVEQETARFMAELHHRATGPIIKRLREGWQQPKDEELKRLFNKLPELDDRTRGEITQSFDRLVNKLLHPPLESLRSESEKGPPHGLLDALKRLFRLDD